VRADGCGHASDCRGAGFSTPEALVALLLVALIGLVCVEAAGGGRKAASSGSARAAAAVRLLQVDAALRRAVREIRVPYWMGRAEARASAQGLDLRFSGGEEARVLRIQAAAGWVSLETTDAEPGDGAASPGRRFGPFARASAEPVFEDGELWGVKATLLLREGDMPVELKARVGSRALPSGDPR